MPTAVISLIKIVLAVLSYIFGAQFSFDLSLGEQVIPITGQSLAVLCWAVFMRPKESVTAVLVYILIGAYLLPVFANNSQGMEVVLGPTGGYLLGFLVASLVVSWIRDPYRKESIFSLLLLMILGTAIILIFGMIRLHILQGFENSLNYGFYQLWKGAAIKIGIGAILCYIIHLIQRQVMKPKSKV